MDESARVANADLDSFARRHRTELTRFAYLVCGDRQLAEDAVQEVLMSLHRTDRRRVEVHDWVAYAKRAIVNQRRSWLRIARNREVPITPTDAISGPAESVQSGPDLGDRDELWRRLDRLSADQRAVLVLRYYEDLPDARIAAILDCREATVRSHAARGLAALRAGYADAEETR